MRHGPVRTAMPLRDHGVGHLIGNRYRAGPAAPIMRRGLGNVASCSLICSIRPRAVASLNRRPVLRSSSAISSRISCDQQLDALGFEDFLPAIVGLLEPVRRPCASSRAPPAGRTPCPAPRPLPEDLLNAIAGQSRDQRHRARQATPGRGRRIVRQRAGQPQRAIAAAVGGIAMLLAVPRNSARELLGGDVGRPPLVGDQRDVHRMKHFVRRVGLRDHERSRRARPPAAQLGGVARAERPALRPCSARSLRLRGAPGSLIETLPAARARQCAAR